MATAEEFVQYVCGQLEGIGAVRYRKMFGEYMVYIDDKPVVLVCDNTVYLKRLERLGPLLADAPVGTPYEGAKPHYLVDPEDRALLQKAAAAACLATPAPRPKRKPNNRKDAAF